MAIQLDYEPPRNSILHGDCADVLKTLPDNYFSAMITDPPAGIAFMGKEWDKDKGGRRQWIDWMAGVMGEAYRTLRPGAHAFVWALPRTSHWTATALEDAGFEIRDVITHLFGSGFPKSLAVDKAIDKAAKAERAKVRPVAIPRRNRNGTHALGGSWQDDPWETSPSTAEPQQWMGWGTALKPASEHWILCRKPISEPNLAANVLRWECGGLNIDACRIGGAVPSVPMRSFPCGDAFGLEHDKHLTGQYSQPHDAGRWPSNVVFSHSLFCTPEACADDCPVKLLDAQAGERKSGGGSANGGSVAHDGGWNQRSTIGYGDTGGASRFFPTFWPDGAMFHYTGKASRREREQGCELLEPMSAAAMVEREPDSAGMDSPRAGAGRTRGAKNHHPTVKSLSLGRWLTRLIGVPEGIILDPFCGSGSLCMAAALEGFAYVGIERESQYVTIARNRVASVTGLWG